MQYNGFKIVKRPEPIIVSALHRTASLCIGRVVHTSQGKSVLLKNEAMVNADSITYTTNHPGLWAKIYSAESLTTLTEEKIKRMLSKRIKYEGLCWPLDILYDGYGVFAGMLIPEAKGVPLSQCIFRGVDNGIKKFFPNWDKRQLTQLTITILEKIKYMHSMGILFGCLNPVSILVKDEKTVYLTDMDHYQIEGFPCMIRNPMFTPPELQDRLRRKKMYLCTQEHEKYAVALLVFMLMMPGKMPYAINNNVQAPDSIMEQRFAFSYKGEHGSDRSVGSWRFVWSHLTPFKETIYRTFQHGEKLNSPERRPSDDRWLEITNRFIEDLRAENLYDPHSRELVPKSFKRSKNEEFVRCRYCGIEHPRFYFFDEYFNDYRICKACLGAPSEVSFTCQDCGRTFKYTNKTAIYHMRMRELDDSWRTQRHCSDCKRKTAKCARCGKEVPMFRINRSNGFCFDCEKACEKDRRAKEKVRIAAEKARIAKEKEKEKARIANENARKSAVHKAINCRDCGRYFEISVGEHESLAAKGYTDPTRCKSCREARKRNRH